jgi:hypothetical protein
MWLQLYSNQGGTAINSSLLAGAIFCILEELSSLRGKSSRAGKTFYKGDALRDKGLCLRPLLKMGYLD